MKILYTLLAVFLAALAEESPALRELTTGNLVFSGKTYKELAKESTGNFLVCPLSVSVVLALVEAGSGGETAKQLIAGLNLPDNEEKIHAAMKEITPSLNVDDQYTLTSANKVYIKDGFKIKSQFKDVATKVFNAQVEEINFTEGDAAEKINKWVLEKTHDKIKDLLSQQDLDDSTRAVLINALYFHGFWEKPFYLEATKDKPFHISTTKEVNVKMMEQTNFYKYYEDTTLNAKFLQMEYRSSPVSMTIVLPNSIDGLATLEANIEKVLAVPKYNLEKVHVQIPQVNVEHKIDFIPILKSFGVEDAFNGKANFTGIIENTDLTISKIVQKTFIAIEEKGTTAAAATAVILNKKSSLELYPPRPIKEFQANRPFIFIVRSSIGVLFVGRYVEPNN